VPFWIWLIRIASLIIFIFFISSLNLPEFHLTDQISALVIAITILLVGINMALSELPAPARRVVMMVPMTAKRWFMRAAVWCWERIKIMLS
jgi:ABC-type multidrug transport system permease subunit